MSWNTFDGPLFALCVGGSVAAGLAIFHVVAAYYHVRYYVLRGHEPETWKIQSRQPRPGHQLRAALMSSATLALGGVVTGVLIYCITQGWRTPIYYDVADYGWPWTLASGVLLFVLNDAGAYYVHRALHHKKLFRYIHRHHHRFIATTPYVTTAVHPLELLALQAQSFLPLLFIPVHAAAIGVVLTYILVFNIVDHSGVRLTSRIPWQGPSNFHDDHHTQFHCNFGQHLMLWDRLHGTLRRQDRRYGAEHFGGQGVSIDDAQATRSPEDLPRFVEYG